MSLSGRWSQETRWESGVWGGGGEREAAGVPGAQSCPAGASEIPPQGPANSYPTRPQVRAVSRTTEPWTFRPGGQVAHEGRETSRESLQVPQPGCRGCGRQGIRFPGMRSGPLCFLYGPRTPFHG